MLDRMSYHLHHSTASQATLTTRMVSLVLPCIWRIHSAMALLQFHMCTSHGAVHALQEWFHYKPWRCVCTHAARQCTALCRRHGCGTMAHRMEDSASVNYHMYGFMMRNTQAGTPDSNL